MRFLKPANVPSRLASGDFQTLITNHEERLGTWMDYLDGARVRDRLGLSVAALGLAGSLANNVVRHHGVLSMLFSSPGVHEAGWAMHLTANGVMMAGFLYQVLEARVASRIQTLAREDVAAMHATMAAHPEDVVKGPTRLVHRRA